MEQNFIASIRKKQHLSQEAFAEKIFVSRQLVSAWEKGKTEPSIENKLFIAKVFHLNQSEVLNLTELEKQSKSDNVKKKIKDSFLVLVATDGHQSLTLEQIAMISNLPQDEVTKSYSTVEEIFFELILESYTEIEQKITTITNGSKEPINSFCQNVLPVLHQHYPLLHILYSRQYRNKTWSNRVQNKNRQLCEKYFLNQQVKCLIHDRYFHFELLIALFTSFIESWMKRPVPLTIDEVQLAFKTYTHHSIYELTEFQ